MKKIKLYEQFVGEAIETAVNTFAKDEIQDGHDAKVFLGQFDGRTFKAQSTNKTWEDGTPVTKYRLGQPSKRMVRIANAVFGASIFTAQK